MTNTTDTNPRLTIVVPVYNTEKWLNDCIDSILTQDFQDYELLLVDDGSTDSSGDICESFAASDKRIQVLHIENGGLGNARNVGIEHASGEYILFVDADDEISKNCISSLLHKEADLVIGSTIRTYKTRTERFGPECKKYYPYEEKTAFINDYIPHFVYFDWSHSKLFKLSVIKDNGIRYNPKRYIPEDKLFINEYLMYAKTFYVTDDIVYYYKQHDGSLSVGVNPDTVAWRWIRALPLYTDVLERMQKTIPCQGVNSRYHDEVVGRYAIRIFRIFRNHDCTSLNYKNLSYLSRLVSNDAIDRNDAFTGRFLNTCYRLLRHKMPLLLLLLVKGYRTYTKIWTLAYRAKTLLTPNPSPLT